MMRPRHALALALATVVVCACGSEPLLPQRDASARDAKAPVRDVPDVGQQAPDEPEEPDEVEPEVPDVASAPIFRVDALAALDAEDRAYVIGHAFALHAYSKALPRYLEGTGFVYVPGASTEEARVVYAFNEVVDEEVAEASDCVLVEGAELCPPEETDPLQDGEDIDDRVDPDGEEDEDEDDDGADSDDAPEVPTPEDPFIDDDCETFLDPAAMEARALVAAAPPRAVLVLGGFAEADIGDAILARYRRGHEEALALEDLDEDTDASEPEAVKPFVREAEICEHSPLVLDLDGDGVQAGAPADGVLFDLKETGHAVRTAWPLGGDALLALDRDGDGRITDGGELFGNSRALFGERRAHGFAALAELDDDGDGAVDAKDRSFTKLVLWRDADRDGVSDAGELASLASAGVVSLSTSFTTVKGARDRDGNDTSLRGSFRRATREGGTVDGAMVDVWFRVQSAHAPVSMR